MLIKDIFNFEKGELQSSKNNHGKYDFITASSEWKTHDSFTHNCEALIFAMGASGSLGRTHYVNGKFIASDLCFILTVKDKINYPINLKFYHTIFNNLRENIVKKTATGTSKIAINKTNFGNYDILYCDIEEQIRIQKIIDDVGFANNELLSELRTQNSLIESIRKSILQEAVQGKLVPQDPNDEPASELLKRIQAEKEKLKHEKKVKKEKLHQKAKNEPSYQIPNNWEWVRFWDVIYCYRGHNPPKTDFIFSPKDGYVRFIQITDFKTNSNAIYVPITKKLKFIRKGEIIMAAYRHIGKLSRDMEGAFNVALCKIMNIEPLNRNYLELLIGSELVKGELLSASGRSHIPSMHSGHLLSLWVPIPPLAEQKRIVAKVDELMSLCGQLETQIQESKENADMLMQSVLQEAFAA